MSPYSLLKKKKKKDLLLPLLYFFFFLFFEILFPLLLLGQASVRSVPEATSSLELEGFEGGRCSPLLCFLSFPSSLSFFMCPSPSFLSMAKPPVSLPSFSQWLRFLHPLFNVLCVLSQGLPSNQRSKRRRLQPRKLILVPPSFLFAFLTLPLSLCSFPLFGLCLILQALTQVLKILSL